MSAIDADAKRLYETSTKAVTGNVWVWDDASEEVKDRFRALVTEGYDAGLLRWSDGVREHLRP